ncbi:MAG TPA: hypothetical protein VFJ72_09030 [Rubrobacteraceae bacterium]|nr:hypothetical protein [Rubrobacteraceae bacterium]
MNMEIKNPTTARITAPPDAKIERSGKIGPAETVMSLDVGVYIAAGLSLVAALVHLWVMPEHLAEWWGYGAFFLAAALVQGFFAVAILRWPDQRLAFAGVWTNLSIVLVYLLSRTSGLPVGPHAGVAEEAGVLDMTATASEVGVIILLVALLGGAYRKFTVNALLLLGLAIWSLRLAGIIY